MHQRRFASFFLGLWLGSGLLMAWVAIDSFRSVDRLLQKPSAAAALQIKKLGPSARALFRHQVAEQNHEWFARWEWCQLIGGSAFFFFLLFATRMGKFPLSVVVTMLVVVAVQRFIITPELGALGANLPLAAPDTASGAHVKFWLMHSGYITAEVGKFGIGLALAIRLALAGRPASQGAREEIDLVDKANYRHVDR
jgi:hypothetical protein